MRYVAGQYLNLLELAKVVTPSPAAAALYPTANLYDYRSGRPFQFESLGADPQVTVDLDRLGGYGNFEAWAGGAPTGWTETNAGTGDTTQEATLFHGGAAAAKLTGGSGSAQIYRDVAVRSGERLTIDAWLRGDGTASIRLRIQNRQTGKYLQSDGTWSASAVDLAARSTTSYAQTVLEFTVESWTACQGSTVTLRVIGLVNTSGSGYLDDVSLYPTVNVCSVHGHNIDPVNTVQLLSSPDNFSASTTEATLTMRRPTFFAYLTTAIKRRYWRLKLTGTNVSAAVYMGELVLAYVETIGKPQQWNFDLTYKEPQIRNATAAGEITVYNDLQDAPRSARMSFRQNTSTRFEEMRNDIFRRCRGGAYPVLVIPMNDEDEILLARIEGSLAVTRAFVTIWENDLLLSEGPFPGTVA